MRIVYLNPVATLGGAERCLLGVLAAVRQEAPDAELHLLALADGPLLEQAEQLGVRVRALPVPDAVARLGDSELRGRGWLRRSARLLGQAVAAAPRLPLYLRRLRKAIAEVGPGLIHSNGIKTHLLAAAAAPRGATVVWHVHDFLGQRPVVARLLRWAARRAVGAIAVSEAVHRDAAATLGGLPVRLLYNTVDVGRFCPGPGDGPRLDRLAGLPPAPADAVRVGLVATYARWKGHDVFLTAARLLREYSGPPLRFYVIGGPIYATHGSQFTEAELRATAREAGIADAVGFIGFQADVAEVYRALDVAVHASTRPEPFGLTIVEAMACGRPVVVSRAGGAAELFTDAADAIAVPPGDAAALAAAIAALARDPAGRDRLAAAARQTAVTRFSSAQLGRQVLPLYRQFLGTSHAS